MLFRCGTVEEIRETLSADGGRDPDRVRVLAEDQTSGVLSELVGEEGGSGGGEVRTSSAGSGSCPRRDLQRCLACGFVFLKEALAFCRRRSEEKLFAEFMPLLVKTPLARNVLCDYVRGLDLDYQDLLPMLLVQGISLKHLMPANPIFGEWGDVAAAPPDLSQIVPLSLLWVALGMMRECGKKSRARQDDARGILRKSRLRKSFLISYPHSQNRNGVLGFGSLGIGMLYAVRFLWRNIHRGRFH